jgi:hypothetical protein
MAAADPVIPDSFLSVERFSGIFDGNSVRYFGTAANLPMPSMEAAYITTKRSTDASDADRFGPGSTDGDEEAAATVSSCLPAARAISWDDE